jgi:hypothetical protein
LEEVETDSITEIPIRTNVIMRYSLAVRASPKSLVHGVVPCREPALERTGR